jgi:hypothetical protein
MRFVEPTFILNWPLERRQPMFETFTETKSFPSTRSSGGSHARACVEVHYQVTMDLSAYHALAEHVASQLARTPGLLWKLWLLEEGGRQAAGLYLFADDQAARAFLDGPTLDGLRQHPAITGVTTRRYGVLADLSLITGGQQAGL